MQTRRTMKKAKARYTCGNCGAAQDRKYTEAMRKAGFDLHHLSCRECGQQQIKG